MSGTLTQPVVYRSFRVIKKADCDERALTATAVLTYPEVDYAGDWVQPDGGVWDERPYVNLEHTDRIGTGRVTLKSLDIDGESWRVPVGTTQFTRGSRLAEQTYRLVADEIMTGVSLEFVPAGPLGVAYKSFGHRSPIEDRDAMEFLRWRGLGWAHTVRPINPNARTLIRDDPALEKAMKVARDGTHAGSALHPLIRKAFAPLLTLPRAVPVSPTRKAMNPEDDLTAAPPTDAPMDAPVDADDGSDTPPTAKAAMDAAQGCSDLASAIRDAVRRSEHLRGKTKLLKLADDLESCAEEASAVGEMVLGDVGGDGGDEPEEPAEPDEGGDEPAPDEPDDEAKAEKAFRRLIKPLTKAADGVLVTKSGYAPRRFRFADLADVPAPVRPTDPELKALQDELDALRRRNDRREPRVTRKVAVTLDAAKANGRI